MTTYGRREVVTRRCEYSIGSPAMADEFLKVFEMATADWRERNGTDDVPGDWCTVESRDDEVVIRFEVEEPPDANKARIERAKSAYAEAILKERTHAGGGGRDSHLAEDDLVPIWEALTGPVEMDRG